MGESGVQSLRDLGGGVQNGSHGSAKCRPPEEKVKRSRRCEFIVTFWILNSISKGLVDSFVYTASTTNFCLEITERFGECNGPMIYQLYRKLSLITQDNIFMSVYFTKLKRLWDELGSTEILHPCTCGVSKVINEMNIRKKLMQFFMGLNDVYGSIRDQVVGIDPLSSINKVYSMVLKFESQKEVLGSMNENVESLDGHIREGCFKLIGYPD
ncbi:hypothetical protein MANES_15G172266v8 [Manihot esculenta]|uniref:Uncharacterized protein n=1 Tax=Manihot esculenta TaxID=3983 RepID=A0ACB7GC46_MANES|nr:hypothetical protein MANES_15G172266v8 [Manihot esculenta]